VSSHPGGDPRAGDRTLQPSCRSQPADRRYPLPSDFPPPIFDDQSTPYPSPFHNPTSSHQVSITTLARTVHFRYPRESPSRTQAPGHPALASVRNRTTHAPTWAFAIFHHKSRINESRHTTQRTHRLSHESRASARGMYDEPIPLLHSTENRMAQWI
jgi:hypothetical protein